MKKPRTSGKEEKENQEGRWPRAFLAILSSRRDPPILRKETSHERSTSKPQNFEMPFLRPWGKSKKPWPWRSIWTYLEGISHQRKSAKELQIVKTQKNEIRTKGVREQPPKISYMTLVMVLNTQKRMMVNVKEHLSSTIKGAKHQPRRAISKKHSTYQKRYQKESCELKTVRDPKEKYLRIHLNSKGFKLHKSWKPKKSYLSL